LVSNTAVDDEPLGAAASSLMMWIFSGKALGVYTEASSTTGQFSTQAPQPVQRSSMMLRARFLTFTLKFPGDPSTLSRSE
jgi:hypothetical protein